jgi:hypothetical protein
MAEGDSGDKWPRGTGDAWRHADPADPLMPQAPAHSDLERRLRAHARKQLPTLASPDLRPVQFAEVFARLAAVAMARAEFYGQLLASQYEAFGEQIELDGWNEDADYDPGKHNGATRALIGPTLDLARDGTPVPTGEAVRALVKLEAEERDRAADLAYKGIRVGIEAKQVDVMRSYGRTVVASLRALCAELGIDWTEETTRLAARRAIVSARTSMGDLLAPQQKEIDGG